MRLTIVRASMLAALTLLATGLASAQTAVTLPYTLTTTITATVSEQAQVTVPAAVSVNVTNIATSAAAIAARVSAGNIVLAAANKALKISVRANATSFTPAQTSDATFAASDVTWNAATFSNGGSGASGTLDSSAYNTVATCAVDGASCSASDFVFTLAANASVKHAGTHTLAMTWMFESVTP